MIKAALTDSLIYLFMCLEFFLYVVAVALRAVAGDHFADETCKEEKDSQDDCHKGEVE